LAQSEAAKEVRENDLYDLRLPLRGDPCWEIPIGLGLLSGQRRSRKGEGGVNVKIGDRVGEYKLAKIAEDRIFLEGSRRWF